MTIPQAEYWRWRATSSDLTAFDAETAAILAQRRERRLTLTQAHRDAMAAVVAVCPDFDTQGAYRADDATQTVVPV